MKLRVLENIYGQYVYIFSVVSCTVDGQSKTSSSRSRNNYSGEGGDSHNGNHKRSNYEENLRNGGEFHCTLAMILD